MDELKRALEYARDQGVLERQVAAWVKAHVDEVRFRHDDGGVRLVHPETGGEQMVPESAVEQHELAGWVRKDDAPAELTDTEREADVQAAAARQATPSSKEKS